MGSKEGWDCTAYCEMTTLDVADLLEIERNKLHRLVSRYSLTNPQVLRQSRIVDHLILCVLSKEKSYRNRLK